ncbi:MAG: hypothetical protein JWO50_654 [Candidatus Kaiserbacteria bacterium]|nr:hypothetical protein [Candidatus Kaiserbacteria bacterium]
MNYQVLLFYKYVTIEDPENFKQRVLDLATECNLLGRVLIAEEGINGTLEGTTEQTEMFAQELLKDERLAGMQIKRSLGTGKAFPRLKIKVRAEIVGTRFPSSIDPRVKTAEHISPETLYNWYRNNEDFVVVDMRNDFEYQSGHFKNSINPKLEASRDLVDAVSSLEPLKAKKVVTVCTGGVRCEKMSAYLLEQGFENVVQLDNGIHSYMEKYPGEDYAGTLYTFDKRLVMDFGGKREITGTCKLCGTQTEQYVNCANLGCHLHFLVCSTCFEGDKTYCSDDCLKSNLTLNT